MLKETVCCQMSSNSMIYTYSCVTWVSYFNSLSFPFLIKCMKTNDDYLARWLGGLNEMVSGKHLTVCLAFYQMSTKDILGLAFIDQHFLRPGSSSGNCSSTSSLFLHISLEVNLIILVPKGDSERRLV